MGPAVEQTGPLAPRTDAGPDASNGLAGAWEHLADAVELERLLSAVQSKVRRKMDAEEQDGHEIPAAYWEGYEAALSDVVKFWIPKALQHPRGANEGAEQRRADTL